LVGIAETFAAIRYRRWQLAALAGATFISVPVIGSICHTLGLI
jgi:hypothetical protein